MRKSMFFVTLVCILAGCSADNTIAPEKTSESFAVAVHAGYVVTVDGSQYGDGSVEHPWALETALAQPGILKPGDTVWVHGGVYKGEFNSALTGTAETPVVLRAFPGEHVVIDGRLNVNGSYAYYWGFEVMSSDAHRQTAMPGSDPTDLPRIRAAVFVGGPFNKLINLVVHDLSNGLFSGASAEGLEVYGSLFYNNGWAGPDRGHGHNVYLQNEGATKNIIDNVLFGSFSSGLQIYGSDAASLKNFLIEGNTIFNSGDPVAATFGHTFNIEHWGGAAGTLGNSIYRNNSIYHRDGRETAARFNAPGEAPGGDLEFSDNIVQGETSFNEMKRYVVTGNTFTSGRQRLGGQSVLIGLRLPPDGSLSSNRWDGNRYAVPPQGTQDPFHIKADEMTGYYFPAWRAATGYDATGAFVLGWFDKPDVVVRNNRYESGRAFVTCWNWTGAATVSVDLSRTLKPGDKFQIHNVFNVLGAPVVTGVYTGKAVSIPQQALTPPAPIGYPAPPAMPDNTFNVFLVERR
ncbi:MAG TPA: hypothetical protein VIM21_12220 [Gemmatimonadaceae bacterium]